jgi:hypothetical protein
MRAPLRKSLAVCLAISVCSGGVAACAGNSDSANGARSESFGLPACFSKNQVSDFRPLDRSNLVVYAPSRASAYHVQIIPTSIELQSANTIAFSSRGSRICGYAGDAVLLGEGRATRNSITRVTRLDEAGLQALLDGFTGNGTDPDIDETESVGAEIERSPENSDSPDN